MMKCSKSVTEIM